MEHTIEQAAKMLYEEYNKSVGGVAWNGDPLPSWEEFYADQTKQKQVNGWLGAAKIALLRIENKSIPTKGMDFGKAIEALKAGKKVARQGWNGKGMYIFQTPDTTVKTQDLWNENNKAYFTALGVEEVLVKGYLGMKAANNEIVVGWLASQTDMLCEDWQVVE